MRKIKRYIWIDMEIFLRLHTKSKCYVHKKEQTYIWHIHLHLHRLFSDENEETNLGQSLSMRPRKCWRKIGNLFNTASHIVWISFTLLLLSILLHFLINSKNIKVKMFILCIIQLKYSKEGNLYRIKYFK